LEFYGVAFQMLSERGARLVMRMALEPDQLPAIVKNLCGILILSTISYRLQFWRFCKKSRV
jgi:hypothetical protein